VIFQQLLDHFLGPRGSEAGELVVPRDYEMKKESKRIVRQRETFDETGPIIYPRRHPTRFFERPF
jgi:hypothetical protein